MSSRLIELVSLIVGAVENKTRSVCVDKRGRTWLDLFLRELAAVERVAVERRVRTIGQAVRLERTGFRSLVWNIMAFKLEKNK